MTRKRHGGITDPTSGTLEFNLVELFDLDKTLASGEFGDLHEAAARILCAATDLLADNRRSAS
jgi:hypothetical protein